MKSFDSCDLCGGNEFEFILSGRDRIYNVPGEYNLKKCLKCGLFFIDPQPSKEELAKHYPSSSYYSLRESLPGWKKRLVILLYKTFYSGNGSSMLKFVLFPLFPIVRGTRILPSGKLLDVGCGSGKFLVYMRHFKMDCYGVEPGVFDKRIATEYGLKIENTSLLEADYPDIFFDVITLNYVLEHAASPFVMLKKIHRLLKPDGTAIIAIPQSNCLAFNLFGERWVQLDIPRHLFIFQVKSIGEYARRTDFKIETIRFNSNAFQFLGSLFYLFNRKREKFLSDQTFYENPLFILLATPFAYFANLFSIGDQFEGVLRKQK